MASIRRISLAMISLALVVPGAGFAQHSDIELGISGTDFFYEGGPVFEGDFTVIGPNIFADDPGFAADEPLEGLILTPDATVGFNVLGSLYYWDGSMFTSPGSTSINIEDAVFGTTTVSGSSGVQLTDLVGDQILGFADGTGELHDHLDFFLLPSPGAPTGAYGLFLSLSTDAMNPGPVGDTSPFGILLNWGLDEADFEAGVDAFASIVVPLPAAGWLLLSGIGMLLVGRRRSAAVPA